MSPHLIAAVGFATGVFEVLATTIGSGLVVGSFGSAVASLAMRGERIKSEQLALLGGCGGGGIALGLLAVDIVAKHFV